MSTDAPKTIDDGGPAFPQPVESLPYWDPVDQCVKVVDIANHAGRVERGASLRDYFAAQAMVGMIAKTPLLARSDEPNTVFPGMPAVPAGSGEAIRNAIAKVSYEYADAMLAARKVAS